MTKWIIPSLMNRGLTLEDARTYNIHWLRGTAEGGKNRRLA